MLLWASPGALTGVLIEDGGLTGALEEAGGGDGGEFTIAGDGAGTGVFLTVGDDVEVLGVGACVGNFEIWTFASFDAKTWDLLACNSLSTNNLFFFFGCGEHRLIKLWIYSCLVGEKIYRKGKPKLQYTSLLASVQISLWQSKWREKGIMGLGIFKGSRERERAQSFFFRVLIAF